MDHRTKSSRQLPLPITPQSSWAWDDLVEDASNAEALGWLQAPEAWPLGRLALHGPEGVGKTHMLRATAERLGWQVLDGPELTIEQALDPARDTALDRADLAPEQALFHLINRCAEAGCRLLLAAREPPARWPTALPDLASRLRATQATAVAGASEGLLAALLAKHLADRQLRVEAGVQSFLLSRLPREAAAIAQAVARLDAASLAGASAITRPFARAVLGLGGDDDRSETNSNNASPNRPSLG